MPAVSACIGELFGGGWRGGEGRKRAKNTSPKKKGGVQKQEEEKSQIARMIFSLA